MQMTSQEAAKRPSAMCLPKTPLAPVRTTRAMVLPKIFIAVIRKECKDSETWKKTEKKKQY